MPEVSIITATYNYGHFLGEAISSVLAQTYQDFELIIVNDGSTDNTRQVVWNQDIEKIKYIYQPNRGVAAALNTGILASRGRLIAFLDADDLWLPQKLELQIAALAASPETSLIYCDMSYFGDKDPALPGTFFQSFRWQPPRGYVIDQLAERFFGHATVLLMKREIFDRVGLFDENLKTCEDYDLLFRIAPFFKFEALPVPLAKYRFHARQLTQNSGPSYLNHIAFFDKVSRSPVLDQKIRRKLGRRLAEAHLTYSLFSLKQKQFARAGWGLLLSAKADLLQMLYLLAGRIMRLLKRRIAAPKMAAKPQTGLNTISA
jgi:glycosyltransferase involved in cell wall biosynthesis